MCSLGKYLFIFLWTMSTQLHNMDQVGPSGIIAMFLSVTTVTWLSTTLLKLYHSLIKTLWHFENKLIEDGLIHKVLQILNLYFYRITRLLTLALNYNLLMKFMVQWVLMLLWVTYLGKHDTHIDEK